jgi:PAS domain S-box-containing protein
VARHPVTLSGPMTFSLRGIAWTAFAVAVVLLVGSSVLLFRATARQRQSDVLVAHTHEVQTVLEDLDSEVFQATNSRRAFVITGNESLLSGYRSADASLPKNLEHLRSLIADNPGQRGRLELLGKDIQSEMDLISTSIEAGERGTSSSQKEISITLRTSEIGDRIHRTITQMRDEEDELLRERQDAARANYQRTLKLIAASFVIALMLLLAEMFLLSYEFTQHQRTEGKARQSQEIVNAFFSSSTVGFGILDSHLCYIRMNDVLPRMGGVTPEDLLGKSITEIFGQRAPKAEQVLRDVLRTGKPVLDREVSGELPGRPGEIRHWLVNYFPLPDSSGKLNQLGIIAVDVTARHHAEDALRKLSGRLLGIQDQERRRIARELHDSLGQYLAGLKIALEMLGRSPAKTDTLLAECSDILGKAITETRTLSHLLHPPLLDEAGFASAASWFVNGFSQRSGIPVALDIPPDLPRLSEAVEIALFRVLQESLTNVHRHSRTRSAEIRVETDAEQITIEICDHGRGVPEDILRQLDGEGTRLGVGLAGMRERIHELGGNFSVTSNENGTTVRASVPLDARGEAEPARAAAERSA